MSAERALEGIREYIRTQIPAHSERGRVSGMPVFRGTRRPMHYLFGHLADGMNLDQFLLDYPYPEREQAVRAIRLGGLLLEAMSYECALAETGDSPHPPDDYIGDRRSVSRESVTTQLHEAAWLGRAESVQALISAAGADPNSYSIRRHGGTALHKAAHQGHVDTVGALLSAGADPNLPSTHWYGGTPLHLATWSGDPETVRALIAGGADPNSWDEYGRTPAEWASMRGEHHLVER
ncbi:MAG: ankyrin repeat domain-containing protein [Chloroflexota bacterium]|nr:ankyrin repeat domain-containing protein [Chloroflexota bacterium]